MRLVLANTSATEPCPFKSELMSHNDGDISQQVNLENNAGLDVTSWWMDVEGNPHYIGLVGARDSM